MTAHGAKVGLTIKMAVVMGSVKRGGEFGVASDAESANSGRRPVARNRMGLNLLRSFEDSKDWQEWRLSIVTVMARQRVNASQSSGMSTSGAYGWILSRLRGESGKTCQHCFFCWECGKTSIPARWTESAAVVRIKT